MTLNLKLSELFSAKTLQRGRSYFNSHHVIAADIDEDHCVISGTVRGSRRKSYHVSINFEPVEEDSDEIEGICSCPMEYNCKHVVALLLEAERQFGADQINALMGEDDEHDNFIEMENTIAANIDERMPKAIREIMEQMQRMGVSLEDLGFDVPEKIDPREQRKRDYKATRERNEWLNRLKASASQHQSSQTLTKNQHVATVYLPCFSKNGNVTLSLHSCRYLKSGELSKPGREINLDVFDYGYYRSTPKWPKSFDQDDRQIVKMAHIEDILTSYNQNILLKGKPGAIILEKVIATGRFWLDAESKCVIQMGEPIQPEVRWIIDEEGNQSPALFAANNDHRLNLITTEPPYYLKASQQWAICGPLINAPNAEVLHTLLSAPPLDNKAITETQKVLAKILPTEVKNTVKQPDTVSIQKVKPTPVLVLDSLPWSQSHRPKKKNRSALFDTDDQNQRLAKANLFFDYQGQRIDHGDNAHSLPSNANSKQKKATVIPRHQAIENNAIHTLSNHLQPSTLVTESSNLGELKPSDLIIALPDDESYQRGWLQFMTDVVPELEVRGWTIEMADDFPFQFEVIPDSDWHAELEESENQWFSLKLGITIDGKQLDLLPMLARQINQLPSPDELKKLNKDATVPVALPGGKYINMPAGRLHLILSTLLELFGDRPQDEYRLENYHAQLWEELYAKLGLPWAGGEKLLALSRKLKSFKRLTKVKPAKTLNADLRPYQQHGLSWLQFLREYGLNGILADDMGLGKTLQTLAHLQLEKQRLGETLKPSLVVCPTSLIHNWRNEANRFTPDLNLHIHHGAQRDSAAIEKADLVLTSYGIIQRDFEPLSKHHFHCLVLDEAQAVKNPQAKGAKAIRCLQAEHKLCLTGTPMENHLGELWSLFDFLMPGFLGAHDQFTRYYRTPIEKHGKKETSKRLQKRIAPFMLRRGKDLVAKELPPKTEIIRTTELTGKQRDLYETVRASMEAKVRSEVEKKGLARSQIFILDALLKMRQTCCDPTLVKVEQAKAVEESAKLDLLMSLVKPMIEEGRRILIFSQFTTMLALIEKRLKQATIDWVKLTGQTRDRNTPISRFQNGEVPVFLISLKAGGTGLNLTAADTVIHYDPWWNPAVEDQASDRAHRIGQDKPVFVYKLVTEGTVEEKIQELKEKKRGHSQCYLR